MDKVARLPDQLDTLLSLSPEYWLSVAAVQTLNTGKKLSDLIDIQTRSTIKISETALILDTGNSDRGFCTVPFGIKNREIRRTSPKKKVPEGAVLISRLRPYLRQICYIPHGTCTLLGVSEILCSPEYHVLTSKRSSDSIAYLVPWLLSTEVQALLEKATTGGHHPRFKVCLLLNMHIPESFLLSSKEVALKVEQIVLQHFDAQLQMRKLLATCG